tara:strand:+ start:29 stop:628 length:600 start_codon:yes stop_codon:yes gene_type:complete
MGTAEELSKLKKLLDEGLLSEDEFNKEKEKLLNKNQFNFNLDRKKMIVIFAGLLVVAGGFLFSQSTIAGETYEGRIRAIDFKGSDNVIKDPVVGCKIDHYALRITGNKEQSLSISSDDGERLITHSFDKGNFVEGYYEDPFGGDPVEFGKVACYYNFKVRLPRLDAYVVEIRTGGRPVTFTKELLEEKGGFVLTLDFTD